MEKRAVPDGASWHRRHLVIKLHTRAWLCGLTFKVLIWRLEPKETSPPVCSNKGQQPPG